MEGASPAREGEKGQRHWYRHIDAHLISIGHSSAHTCSHMWLWLFCGAWSSSCIRRSVREHRRVHQFASLARSSRAAQGVKYSLGEPQLLPTSSPRVLWDALLMNSSGVGPHHADVHLVLELACCRPGAREQGCPVPMLIVVHNAYCLIQRLCLQERALRIWPAGALRV